MAASRATPAPVMPPPMTRRSNRAWLNKSSAARRALAENGRVTPRRCAGRGDDRPTLLCSTYGNREQWAARRDRRGTPYALHQIRHDLSLADGTGARQAGGRRARSTNQCRAEGRRYPRVRYGGAIGPRAEHRARGLAVAPVAKGNSRRDGQMSPLRVARSRSPTFRFSIHAGLPTPSLPRRAPSRRRSG